MQLRLGTKLTIKEIESVKKEINEALKMEHGNLELITPEPIEEIDVTGIQLLLTLKQSTIILLKVSVQESQLEYLNSLGFDLEFIN